MKKTRNLPENFRITNHNRIEGGYKSTKFWFSDTCLVVQKRFRVLQKCEQKQNQYWQMWNQSHEIIKPVSKLDSNLSIPYVDSRVQIPRNPHGFQPGKKKKWIRFWIKWNEESWKNLVKGTQVPVARAIIIHEIKAMNPVPFSPHESHVTTIVQCVQCVQCVQLLY